MKHKVSTYQVLLRSLLSQTTDNAKKKGLEDLIQDLEDDRLLNEGPRRYYNPDGDILHVHMNDGPYTAKWIDHTLTVHLDMDDQSKIVGYSIWGVKSLFTKLFKKEPRSDDPLDEVLFSEMLKHLEDAGWTISEGPDDQTS